MCAYMWEEGGDFGGSYGCLASCLMSADSSYAEFRILRDRFDKSWLENSETRAFISQFMPSTRLHPSHAFSYVFLLLDLFYEMARLNRCMEIE